MNSSDSNPAIIALFFVLRCLVPLAVMLGISYLLRRLKLIAEPPKPPPGWDNKDQELIQQLWGRRTGAWQGLNFAGVG